jgi:hypothetical protein
MNEELKAKLTDYNNSMKTLAEQLHQIFETTETHIQLDMGGAVELSQMLDLNYQHAKERCQAIMKSLAHFEEKVYVNTDTNLEQEMDAWTKTHPPVEKL